MATKKKASKIAHPDYYINSRGEVLLKPTMSVNKLHGKYIIFDPSQIEEPREFMVIGKGTTWEIKARKNDYP